MPSAASADDLRPSQRSDAHILSSQVAMPSAVSGDDPDAGQCSDADLRSRPVDSPEAAEDFFQASARTKRHQRKAERRKERRLAQRQLHDSDHDKLMLMAKHLMCHGCGEKHLAAAGKNAKVMRCERCDGLASAGIVCSSVGCMQFTCQECRLDEHGMNEAFWAGKAFQ